MLWRCLAQAISNPWFWAALSLCCQRRRATYEIWRRLEGHVQIIFEMLWCIMWKKKQQPLGSRRSLYTIKRDPAPCSQCFPSPACCPNRNSFPAVPALFLNSTKQQNASIRAKVIRVSVGGDEKETTRKKEFQSPRSVRQDRLDHVCRISSSARCLVISSLQRHNSPM